VRIAFLTGAGMSAESGVPTFRDALTGLWARFDPERLATEAAFREDPALVWGWYRWRAALVSRAQPNAGHLGIARLQDRHQVQVVTQNVDDLHERAGSRDVVHLHGSLFASRCIGCGRRAAPDPIVQRMDAVPADGGREAPPHCAGCGDAIRPGVVWFGEALPDVAWHAATEAIAGCDVLIVVGTSGLVHPAAALPAHARETGRRVLEINPTDTPIAKVVHASWREPAGAGIARLERMLADGDLVL
jgi:NAD-dependent deacetylase